jgi:hypothetical protein
MTISNVSRSRVSPVVTLIIGLALGWTMTSLRPPMLRANGGDRSNESILATGPTFIRYNEGSKIQVAHDAVYFLDYGAGKLLATIPSVPVVKAAGPAKFLESFAERDLVADFKIDPETGSRPHFLMTTSATWYGSSQAYGDGGSFLLVFETTTRQVAVYKAEQNNYGPNSPLKLELLQVRSYTQPPSGLR